MKNNLEKDLLHCDTIIDLCDNNTYAQNLYAALCNNTFEKNGQTWSCSWRWSAGIVSDIRWLYKGKVENYMDWYCSGSQKENAYVSEGTITKQIRKDLEKIGWKVVELNTTTKFGGE